jgi:pyridoxamine 5'-phosphate oxidase
MAAGPPAGFSFSPQPPISNLLLMWPFTKPAERPNVADLRQEYRRDGLIESAASGDPFEQFDRWMREAIAADAREPNAMTLATAGPDGPAARTVLLKGYDARGFVFYSNGASRKGQHLKADPRASLLFWWEPLERQVEIRGAVVPVSSEETAAYFSSRPEGSQLGAWASPQSSVVQGREELERRLEEARQRFAGQPIPPPPHWGGFRVVPRSLEFWQGRPNRLHDRLRYTREEAGGWRLERLAP